MTNPNSSWTGMIPVEDTALAGTDTGGPGTPVIYLNGSYTSQGSWRPVIAELGPQWRHITFDERTRGKSKQSSDYSFEACIRDIDAVLAARGWTGRCWWAGLTGRRSRCTGLPGIRSGSLAW